jgi:hypothetical protein
MSQTGLVENDERMGAGRNRPAGLVDVFLHSC